MEVKDFFDDAGLLAQFIDLPYRIYAGDPRWVPPFRDTVKDVFDPALPFFKNGIERRFVVFADGKVIARAAACVNPRMKENSPPLGLVGFFECEDVPEAAVALFGKACEWLLSKQCSFVRAPVDRDTWHRYRAMTRGFREKAIFNDPYNKPYYPRLFDAAGFKVCSRYKTTMNNRLEDVLSKNRPFLDTAVRKGYSFRRIDMQNFDSELEKMYKMAEHGFEDDFCYASITLEEFRAIYAPLKELIDPALIVFAIAPDGREIGYAFALPERSEALWSMGGSRGWWGRLQFWLNTRSKSTIMNYTNVAVVPEHRGIGLGAALTAALYEGAIEQDYRFCRHSLMREDNSSGRYDYGLGGVYKTYALYQKTIA